MKKLLSLLLLLAAPSLAQSYPAKRFVFKNPGQASQSQLESVIGMHGGATITTAGLSAAVQKIADTGFYDDVQVVTEGPSTGLTVIFTLTPRDPAGFLPAGFENFVWLTPDEITHAIRTRVPLYNGTLPEAGPQADDAIAALTAALAAKHINNLAPGVGALPVAFRVERETVEPTLEHPLRVMEFRITNPAPIVANVHLAGVTPDLVPLLQKSVNRVVKSLYNEGRAGFITQEAIVAPLLDAGYAQALLSHMTMEIGAPDNGRVPLVLNTTLAPGPLFHVAAINFAGTPLLSAEAFTASAKLHSGDLASRALLLQTLAPVDAAYRAQGYMDVIVKADPEFNAPASTVTYTVSVTPGQQYRLKEVTAEGLDPAAKADFDKYFKLHPGDVYDESYVRGYLKNNTALFSLAHYTGSWKAYAHPADHTVDLVISFFNGKAPATTITVH